MTTVAGPDETGRLIAGRYRIERTLGRGGMAVVYRARDERVERHVALKRCSSSDSARQARSATLLEREYHTLTQLAHPHIIEVYDFGRDELGPYYTMELLEGEDLSTLDVLAWQDACGLLRDIASSLAILHSRGLIHRDVALRNVHRTADGRAKLIDFGAMTSMGVSKDMVGTPPFLAPEVLQLQALDARVDLYSLGAVAYRLLTGRHAFPARRVADLRDVWRSRPQAPAAIKPEIPAALSKLVLRMLSLDRAGRPQSAAEVIEQLSAIADLPRENTRAITRAYLTTPVLVGREAPMLEVRRRMLSLVRGDGGVLSIEGSAGSGRSRVLDGCALEAKLLSVTVVRADARDALAGDWGVARALGTQLLALFPAQALEAARLSRHVLAHVITDLQPDDGYTSVIDEPDRSLLIRELRDWILSLAKQQRLLLAVDDADQIDGPSAALLSALANKVERSPILLAVTVERDVEHSASAAFRLLRDVATTIALEDMLPHDTEALVRSLFGEAPNVDVCAARLHGLSNGNPRATIELAQHMVDTGRAVYEGGSWVLPRVLDETDLPHSLSASLAARLQMLSADARELVGALALADGTFVELISYPALTKHGDGKRAFRALDELVAARVLSADADRYSFVQRGFLAVVKDSMSKAERKAAHRRIARRLAANGGDPIRRAEHLLAAGEAGTAIELLCRFDLRDAPLSVTLLESAVRSAERLTLPAATVHRLRMALLIHASFELEVEAAARIAPVLFAQLEKDSGLASYRELAHLPAEERLRQALSLTQQRYLATVEQERVQPVLGAIQELAQLYGALSGMAVATLDVAILDLLPVLDPLFPLSPTLSIVSQLVEAARHWVHGRIASAYALYKRIQARVCEPDRAGLEQSQYDRVRYGIDYALGMLDGRWGADLAEDRASTLEERSEFRVNAWRIRTVMNLGRGNVLESRRCSRRAELLEAQRGSTERYGGTTVGVVTILYASLEDLLGVKGMLQTLAALATKSTGWRATHMLAQACYALLQGDLPTALESIESALAITHGKPWCFFGVGAGVHVRILERLGRGEEAVKLAREYVRITEAGELESSALCLVAGLVLARHGQPQEAEHLLGNLFAHAEFARAKGFALGAIYETAALIALETRDVARFESYLQSCAREFELSRNPALGARLSQLIDEAREKGVYPDEAPLPMPLTIQPVTVDTEVETIHSRMLECVDASDRARCALTLLLQSTSSASGYLYATMSEGRLRLSAALPDSPPDSSVGPWVECCGRSWVEPSDVDDVTANEDATQDVNLTVEAAQELTVTSDESSEGRAVTIFHVDPEGRHYTAVPLYDVASSVRRLVAVFVCEGTPMQRVHLPRPLTLTIARDLIEFGDASGWVEGYSSKGLS